MDVSAVVRTHYGGDDLVGRILAALADAGVDTAHLRVEDLAPVDQLHAGFLPATLTVLEQLELGPQTRLLDVGCGIGGPARTAAKRYGCPVVGIDLSPDFVRTAETLTDAVGLADLVSHRVSSGDALALPDASLDRAMLLHVGMNIADKAAVFAEVRRVLRPGGLFVVYEQMRGDAGELGYPLPWAEDPSSSFVATPADYRAQLTGAGFEVERSEDWSARAPRPAEPAAGLSPAAVFGPGFGERLRNNLEATRAGLLRPVLMVARAV